MSWRPGQAILSPSFLALVIAIGCITAFTLAVPARDSLSYWTAGHQLVHRANPYDAIAVEQLESAAAGFHGPRGSLIMLNPPSALPLVLPLGLVSARLGGWLWSLCLLGCLVASVRMVWTMHGRPGNSLHILGYCFAPAIACIFAGQIPLFALLGLALFLRLHRTHPLWAGAGLWLCAVKPHLFLPFGVALLAWILVTKRYKIALGAIIAFAASSAVILPLDPSAWTHYRQMMHSLAPAIAHEFIPCLSVVLRRSLNPHMLWLQGIPAILGCIWGLGYFWKHRHHWDWIEHGSLLMLVSVFVAPYTWLIDQSVLIPALLHGAYRARSRAYSVFLLSASALILIQIGLGAGVRSPFNLWPAPFWLVLYLFAEQLFNRKQTRFPRSQTDEAFPLPSGSRSAE
jgi:hypothetical protein